MTSLRVSIFLILLLTGGRALSDNGFCPQITQEQANLTAAQFSRGDGHCLVQIHKKATSTKRGYVFSDSGLVQFFTIYEGGTGARSYYMFPRRTGVCMSSTEGQFAVRLTNGGHMTINAESGLVEDISGASFQQTKEIAWGDQGGIRLRSTRGIILDLGFRRSFAPHSDGAGFSQFRDSLGAACSVQNSVLFDYEYVKGAAKTIPNITAIKIKYSTDLELARFLELKCPQLDRSSLLERSPDLNSSCDGSVPTEDSSQQPRPNTSR
jgi:hypothetical protein